MSKNPDFNIRAIEVHSSYVWDFHHMLKVLDYAHSLGFNTLILHRNDIIECTEYPGYVFSYPYSGNEENLFDVYSARFRDIFKNTPTRRSNVFNKRAYLKRLLYEAGEREIDVYVENKELSFPDILTYLHPEIVKDGNACPTDPFWPEYIDEKYKEFFRDYPEVKGVITSVATSESKLSIKTGRCKCERCSTTKKEDWYRSILGAMHESLSKLGKTLIVRDFVFDSASQKEIAKVMEELDDDVIISLKNTPHDYYPTFPINKRIGNVGKHQEWIEFDAMGQYFGFGLGVADLTEDYRKRFTDAKEKGAKGIIVRTDWESLDGHSVFFTPNLINIYSAAMLSKDLKCDPDLIYKEFLKREGWIEKEDSKAVAYLRSILSRTWDVTSKTLFVDGAVFSDSSTMPISLEHAVWLAEEKNSLKDWDEAKADAIAPKKHSIEKMLKEKAEAKEMMDAIVKDSKNIPSSIAKEKGDWFIRWLEMNRLYVELFSCCTKALLSGRYLLESKEDDLEYREKMLNLFLSECFKLSEMEIRLRKNYQDTEFSEYIVYSMLDPDRISTLLRNIEKLAVKIEEERRRG